MQTPDDNYCPECGAGPVPGQPGAFRLPRGYPFDKQCSTCPKRFAEAARATGQKLGEEWERRVFEAVLGTPR